jgi:hypothetical protein
MLISNRKLQLRVFVPATAIIGPTKREKGQDFIVTLCINTAFYPTLHYKNWINTMRRLEQVRTWLFAIVILGAMEIWGSADNRLGHHACTHL